MFLVFDAYIKTRCCHPRLRTTNVLEHQICRQASSKYPTQRLDAVWSLIRCRLSVARTAFCLLVCTVPYTPHVRRPKCRCCQMLPTGNIQHTHSHRRLWDISIENWKFQLCPPHSIHQETTAICLGQTGRYFISKAMPSRCLMDDPEL